MWEQKRHSFGNTDLVVIQILFKQEESRNWTRKCAFRAGWVKSFIFLFVKSNLDMLIVQKCLRCISFSWLALNVYDCCQRPLTLDNEHSFRKSGWTIWRKVVRGGKMRAPSHSGTTPPPHSGQTQIRFQSSNSKFDLFHVEILCAHKHGAYMYYGSFTPCVFVMQSCF